VALAALRGHIRRHNVLTMSLATVLCHLDTASFHLQAGKTCPGEKRKERQSADYPVAMSAVELHLIAILMLYPASQFPSIPVTEKP